LKIGFHLPISKGFDWTLKEAIRLQCDVIQIFVKNPRSWTKKEWKNEEIDDFKVLSDTVPVIAHLSYLPNLAKIDLDERHMNGFMHEVELCRQLGIDNLVIHCGSRANKEKGVKMVAEAINRAHEEYDISIVLENSSGQGESIGNNIDELLQIYECTRHKHKVFLCIDTAHIYQAGYDIRTKRA